MNPIEITDNVSTFTNSELKSRLEFLSYKFCVFIDCMKKEAIDELTNELEMISMEGLMRILESKNGFRPLQNKIYETVERVFYNQEAYNINRMMSSIRRTKVVSLDLENNTYMAWMKNRVNYGAKAIVNNLGPDSKSVNFYSNNVIRTEV